MFGTPPGADVIEYLANSLTSAANWHTWTKKKTASMVHILLIGAGGKGGLGVAGANSTAAGGGGGGSGSQTSVLIPAYMLPDALFISLAYGGSGVASFVQFNTLTNAAGANVVALANAGGNGGNAVGATAGAAGTAGAIAPISSMHRAGMGFFQLLAGQAGLAGGTTVAGAAQAVPNTGLFVAGGTGGGGLPAAAAVGTAGGSFTGAGAWSALPGGTSAGASSTGGNGATGIDTYNSIWLPTPGTGGASGGGTTGGSGSGGRGSPGCGGGGSGGCITGQVVGTAGDGGMSVCIITQW